MKYRCKFTHWRVLGVVLLLLQFGWSTALLAAVAADFFEASVPVADRSGDTRQSGLKQALETLLIRISGDPAVAQHPNAISLLSQAGHFVQQYQYVADSQDPDKLLLEVVFDGTAVEQAMRAAALPVWGRERPELLAWVAVEERGRRRLLSADDDGVLKTRLEAVAKQRGLPVLLPLMDLEDQAAVQIADVWGGFIDPLRSAAARYHAQGMLVGRVTGAGDYWSGRWILVYGPQQQSWTSQAQTQEGAVSAGIDQLANRLAERLAVHGVNAPPGVQLVIVEGVKGIADFARISHYLRQLSLVDTVTLHRVVDGRMELFVSLNGGLDHLHQAVAIGNLLDVEATQPVPVYRVK